ncbi:aliphatic sulfonate ABC transporter substrate-binding protein [Paraburkholderia sp. NMBU_R16]|uniref:sulfonate ABC transporter substrate-binding protein n=1 Tax=Paraburkholderia sp. NMBU_R16 TaxID=2698676 RepID=UPI00156586D6|nr:sulfonate ABC transporter substrate-binding protein [Paraburkholderia sp. NMBU_R16]NRO94639.1 aliphatic sulfonate ABC transporter substrate-binding protein [Paraburkholderia sp. NMBU_R16]
MSSANDNQHVAGRRRWLKAAAVGGAMLASGAAAAGFGPAVFAQGPAKTLRIGYQKYGTLVLLKARGTLEKRVANEGVTVKWLEFPAGPQLLEGLNAGAIDFGTVGETPPIFAQAAGVDFVYVANEPPAPTSEAIVVPRNSPIKTVADLRGKRVALNRGSNVHYLLVRALRHAGLDYADIQPAYLAPADARAAFTQGSVDAWVIWDPYFAAIQRQAEARVLVDGTGLVDNTQFYLAARKFAAAEPKLVHAVLEELAKADAWAKAHPAEVARELAPLVGLDASTVELAARRAAYGATPVTAQVLASQQAIADTFGELKLIPKRIAVHDAQWLA